MKNEGRNENLLSSSGREEVHRAIIVTAGHDLTLTQPNSVETVTEVTSLQHVALVSLGYWANRRLQSLDLLDHF